MAPSFVSSKAPGNDVPLRWGRDQRGAKEPSNHWMTGVSTSSYPKPVNRKRRAKSGQLMRYFVLWLFGVPVSVIVWLWVLEVS